MFLQKISKYLLLSLLFLSILGKAEIVYPYNFPKFLQENKYIVQGIASSCESSVTCKDEIIYISIYHKKKKSIILSYQGEEKSPKQCHYIKNTILQRSHVGGLSYYKNNLYISSKKLIGQVKLPSNGALQKTFNATLKDCTPYTVKSTYKVPVSSFTSTVQKDGEDYLLVGAYCAYKSKKFCSGRAYAYLYELDKKEGSLGALVHKYKLPNRTQGADIQSRLIKKDNLFIRQDYLVVSSNNKNHLRWYVLSEVECKNNIDCPKSQDLHKFTTLPKMQLKALRYPEDLAITSTKVWSLSENPKGQKIFYFNNDESLRLTNKQLKNKKIN